MNLTLDEADQIIAGALVEARRRQTKPMAVMVLDEGGHPVAFRREDGASLFRHDIARGKAMSALGMGCDTREIATRAASNPVFFNSVSAVTGLVSSAGGVLIGNAAGEILGAVGISGDTADVDDACAIAGIVAAKLYQGSPQ